MSLSRRAFLQAGAATAGGLLLTWGAPARGAPAGEAPAGEAPGGEAPAGEAPGGEAPALGDWLRVATDGAVLLGVDKAEMGQGIHTALALVVAEELGVPLAQVQVTTRTLEGPARRMSTGASSSVRESVAPLRRAAAAARDMLVAEAAERLAVAPEECRAEAGRVVHPATGRAHPFADLAQAAARRPVPDAPTALAPGAARLVGRSLPRLDVPAKVAGTARYGIDVDVPGLAHAAVAMPDALGGTVAGFDADAARREPGVLAVVELRAPAPPGVAVVAERFWQAERALSRAGVRFLAPDGGFESEAYAEALDAGLGRGGALALHRGDPDQVLADVPLRHRARYQVPFLAHATLEPQNCTAWVRDGSCEIWAPTQSPGRMRPQLASMLGLALESVRIHTTYLGGGFGRRYEADVALQAAQVSRAVGRPVRVLWTRTQDLRHDFYRPAFAAELRAGLGQDGLPRAWWQRVAGPWYEARDAAPWARRFWARLTEGDDRPEPSPTWNRVPAALRYRVPPWMRSAPSGMALGGAGPAPYAVPAARLEFTLVDAPVPLGYWRSVAHSQNAFFVESFVDELAHRAGRDPWRYRRELLAGAPRALAVLDGAARLAGWQEPLPPGRGRGIAVHPCFGSYVAMVAEVESSTEGSWRVVRIACVADCGRAIHPDGVRAQLEGGIVFGLSTLDAAVTWRGGAPAPSNFHDFPIPTLADAPAIDVSLVESDAAPGGVGELATPSVAPAVVNALFAATGRRERSLPLRGRV